MTSSQAAPVGTLPAMSASREMYHWQRYLPYGTTNLPRRAVYTFLQLYGASGIQKLFLAAAASLM